MSKLLHLIALSSLAVLLSSSGASVNAVSVDSHGVSLARRTFHHEHVAKKKRSTATNSARCKARSSSAVPTSTSKAAEVVKTSTKAAVTSTKAATTAKAVATTAAASSSSGGGGGGGDANGSRKVGLAWPDGATDQLPGWMGSKTQLLYTWSPTCPSNTKSAGFTCAIMCWGWDQVDQFKEVAVEGYATYAMGPNEPNQSGQSDMSAASGAQLWNEYIAPLRNIGYTLVSPACTSAPDAITWMNDFFDGIGGKDGIDILAYHWYATETSDFESYLTTMWNTWGKPLWITEYACQSFSDAPQCTADETYAFHQSVSAFMDNLWYVYAYFPYGAMLNININPDNSLMASSGYPNSLGYAYIDGFPS